jgi:GAF domain-containing protein
VLPDYRVRQRDYLLEIARSVTQELDLDKLLERVLKISLEMLTGHAGLVALRNESGSWRVRVADGIPPVFLRIIEPYLNQIPTNTENLENFELQTINQVLKELANRASLGLLTGVGLPMVARSQVIGIIFVFRNHPDLFSANDRTLLSSFANQAAIAVQNAQLYLEVTQQKQRMDALLDSSNAAIRLLVTSLADHLKR